VESCLFIPPGRATAAKPLSAFASVLRYQSSAIGGFAAPVAAFATPLGSGFVEMILHLPIQNQPHSLPATSYSLLS
jgi:hypothetical protein